MYSEMVYTRPSELVAHNQSDASSQCRGRMCTSSMVTSSTRRRPHARSARRARRRRLTITLGEKKCRMLPIQITSKPFSPQSMA